MGLGGGEGGNGLMDVEGVVEGAEGVEEGREGGVDWVGVV